MSFNKNFKLKHALGLSLILLCSIAKAECPHPNILIKEVRNMVCEVFSVSDHNGYPGSIWIDHVQSEKLDQYGNLICIYPSNTDYPAITIRAPGDREINGYTCRKPRSFDRIEDYLKFDFGQK